MTVVVGVVGEGGVLLAADSQSSGDNAIRMRREPKTFQFTDTIAVASCGSARFGQIVTNWLDDYLEEPYPPLMADELTWAVRVFIPALIDCLEEHGHLHRYEETSVVELGESAFLLAIRDRLFVVEPDMQVSEEDYAFSALGSGEAEAMGAMLTASGEATTYIPDDERLAIAAAGVKAASKLTAFVGGPQSVIHTVRFSAEEKKYAKTDVLA
jgi:ATP-dependent protease HslVU (ClpYQ) peptidase subunit